MVIVIIVKYILEDYYFLNEGLSIEIEEKQLESQTSGKFEHHRKTLEISFEMFSVTIPVKPGGLVLCY